MKNLIFGFLAFFVISITAAQNYKFGKVSKEELQEKFNPNDTAANATVLYKNESIKFDYSQGEGFIQLREVHERIKIYNKEGFDWATKKVRIYNRSSSNKEILQGLKGYTYTLKDGKITKQKLKKESIFEEVANKYWKYKSFTLPNIDEGCVIEYSYEISSPYLQIDDVNLQSKIPIKKLYFKVSTPEYFIYNKLINPKASYIPKLVESTKNRTITQTDKNRISNSRVSYASTSFSESKLALIENIISCNETNIPALKEEPLVDNINNYSSKLIMELTATKFPNSQMRVYSTSWEKVTKNIYKNPNFGDQLTKTSYFEDDLNALISTESDKTKKAFLIYNYVKSKVKWNGYYGYTSDSGVKKAYKEGAGNSADINLMLVSMLRYAGIKANPVLVSTKNNGIPLLPTRQGFNYVICMIENEKINALLDATDQYSTFNVLPERILNWKGRVIRENSSSTWINLLPKTVSKETFSLNIKITPELTIEGKVRSHFTGYLAKRYRNKYANISNEDHIKYLEKDNGELIVSNIEFENQKTSLLPLKLSYSYELEDSLEEIGDKLYFSPMLFLADKENPFKQEKRIYPIDLKYPTSQKYMINIMLPKGYIVESLPENIVSQFNSEKGKFSYIIKENGKFLQLIVNVDLKTSFVLPTDYLAFKEFVQSIIDKQSEKVVLKKI